MGRAPRQLNLAGVFAATVTPNRPGTLDIDYPALLDLLDFLTDRGVTGVCLMGSTGEFLKSSVTDRQRLTYLAAKRTRVPLLVGVGHTTLTGALQLAGDAISSGADALLVMPPPFFAYAQPETEAFLREFAREAGDAVPLLLYNVPQFTSAIGFETAQRLLESGLYSGIKDSSGDWDYFSRLIALKAETPFALLAGNDRIALRALEAGADGIVSGCACAIPEVLSGLYKAFAAQDREQTARLDAQLQEFCAWIERFPTPIGVKRAVELRGQKAGEPAVPLSSERAEELGRFSEWFRSLYPRK